MWDKWDKHVFTWILNDSSFWLSKNFSVGRFDLGGSPRSIKIKAFKLWTEACSSVELYESFPETFVSPQMDSRRERYGVLNFQQKKVKLGKKGFHVAPP